MEFDHVVCKVMQGDIPYLCTFIKENPDKINNTNHYGATLLHFASVKGNKNIVSMLLKAGARLTLTDKDGYTPLHWAAVNNQYEVVELLVSSGSNINTLNKNGYSSLHKAILNNYIKVVEVVFNTTGIYNVQINQQDSHRRTPLYMACEFGHSEIVDLLLKSNPDVNVVDMHGRTPLHMACRGGHSYTVQVLLKSEPNINMVDKWGKTALHMACGEGHCDIVAVLMQSKPDPNVVDSYHNTPLHLACLGGHSNIVEVLLKSNPDVNVVDKYGYTPLHMACLRGYRHTVELLLKSETNVYVGNKYGNTPLHLACLCGHSGTVGVLLNAKPDVNGVSRNGSTPLHLACSSGHSDTVKVLLQAKPDVNVLNKFGKTPLDLTVLGKHHELVRLMLSQDQIQLDIGDSHRRTPLLHAVSTGHFGIVHTLVSKGADVNAEDKYGDSCLHLALKMKEFHSEKEHIDILDEICSQLSLSKECRLTGIVAACYLAEQGANFYEKNNENIKPFDLIEDSDLKERLKIFISTRLMCMVCGDNRAAVTLHPCGHKVTCGKCYSKNRLKKCLQCRQPITSKSGFECQRLKEEDLLKVAHQLGSKWQQVGIYLGIKYIELDIIKCDNPFKTVDQSFHMLYNWLNSCMSERCTINSLRESLKENECFEAIECLQKKDEFHCKCCS